MARSGRSRSVCRLRTFAVFIGRSDGVLFSRGRLAFVECPKVCSCEMHFLRRRYDT